MEGLTHVGAAGDELGTRRLDVIDDEEQSLTDPGTAVVTPLPKWMEHGEPGGVICTARQSAPCEVGVQPPAQALVEPLGAIDVGHRKDDDLELQVDGRGARGLLIAGFVDDLCAHDDLRQVTVQLRGELAQSLRRARG